MERSVALTSAFHNTESAVDHTRLGIIPKGLVVALVLLHMGFGQLHGQASQAEISEQLLNGDRSDRMSAAHLVTEIPVAERTPALRQALVTALEREGEVVAQRRHGEIGPLEQPMLVARLAMVVAELRSPETIPALVGALGNSPPAVDALADFGEPAARAVLQVVSERRAPASSRFFHALLTLRLLLERSQDGTLSRATLDAIRSVAAEQLSQPESDPSLWIAIQIAVILDDDDLRSVVETLARDPAEIVKLGITDEDSIQRTQALAQDALVNGVEPLW